MRAKHRNAIELLLSYPDTTVAEMVGVRLSTLRDWMKTERFMQALREREREQETGAKRIARQAVVNSAARLCQLAVNPDKPDTKVLVDVLKVSGVFDLDGDDPGSALAEVVKAVRESGEPTSDQPE
ncbi:MAG: hypothetical protein GX141_08500 [Armatimonadetes bacterium]|jgi:hypothetical protein|nr:hypothetical protein [Armatimonadota bacterium]